MMLRTIVHSLLVLTLAIPTVAGDLDRHVRFDRLHGQDTPFETTSDRRLRGGLQISGEKIVIENGGLTASIQKVAHPMFEMTGVAGQARMPLDAAFLADPITTAINNVLTGSTFTIAQMKNLRKTEIQRSDKPSLAAITLTKIKLVHNLHFLKGSLKAPLVSSDFVARSGYDKATRKLTIVVDKVIVAGFSVPLGVAFAAMNQFISYPFVTMVKPKVVIDLTSFLPQP